MLDRNRASRSEDTTLTKIFVGGLAWETKRDGLKVYFEKFGEVLESVVVTDRITGRSRGYGFVTFREAEAARKACQNHHPVIDGRRANCNLASLGAHKNRSYSAPQPGWERLRQNTGLFSRSKPRFNGLQQSRPWNAHAYPTYQYLGYSNSPYTMNYYNVYRGQHFPTYYQPPQGPYFNYHPFYNHYGQIRPDTRNYHKPAHDPLQFSASAPISKPRSPAVTAERGRAAGPGATGNEFDHKQST